MPLPAGSVSPPRQAARERISLGGRLVSAPPSLQAPPEGCREEVIPHSPSQHYCWDRRLLLDEAAFLLRVPLRRFLLQYFGPLEQAHLHADSQPAAGSLLPPSVVLKLPEGFHPPLNFSSSILMLLLAGSRKARNKDRV